jgi:hypothetical protein
MKNIKNILITLALMAFLTTKACAADAWINDLRPLFLSNNSIIYALNIRTFNANDKNGNGIIEENLDEESGTFLNAIERLDEIKSYGINTIHVLPITPVGKVKALGTAGSLYSAASFNELNPQLKAKNSDLTLYREAQLFIEECHKRKIRVIVDLPSCGAYDLYLKNPGLFKLDKDQNPIIPCDWTDVRLLDAGENSKINTDVYNLYEGFVDLMTELGTDGIRADVATIKPYAFWKKLIDETRVRNPQFLFLAEASDSWREPPSESAPFTPYDKLLEAGFDGYYGSYFNIKSWKTAKELYNHVNFNANLIKKFPEGKSVIGSFATHDEVSPMLTNGPQLSKMIVWLNATLPLNSYTIDGFQVGDKYLYSWANKKSPKTSTDDEYYFVHRGKIDIFNFSRKPWGENYDILQDFVMSNRLKSFARDIISQGDFKPLKTSSATVFAYSRNYNKKSIIVIGNLDFKTKQKIVVNVPKLTEELNSIPMKINNMPILTRGKISVELTPGEVVVLYIDGLDSK